MAPPTMVAPRNAGYSAANQLQSGALHPRQAAFQPQNLWKEQDPMGHNKKAVPGPE
jgi:hypothetical protein